MKLPPKEWLLCHDRSIGHVWDQITWEDGPTVRAPNKPPVYLTYRKARCARCGTERRETFSQDGPWIVKQSAQYNYHPDYKLLNDSDVRLSVLIHTELAPKKQVKLKAV